MTTLPLIVGYRLARQAGLTTDQVEQLWQAWIAQFRPLQQLEESGWSSVTDVSAAVDAYQTWESGLAAAPRQIVQNLVSAYLYGELVRLTRKALAGQ